MRRILRALAAMALAVCCAAGHAQAQTAPCTPFSTFPLALNLGAAPLGTGGVSMRCANQTVQSAINRLGASAPMMDAQGNVTISGGPTLGQWQGGTWLPAGEIGNVTLGGTPISTVVSALAPKANPTFSGTVTAPNLTLSGSASVGEIPGLTVAGRSLSTWLTGHRVLLLTWFGCDPTGVADSTSCIGTAISTAKALGGADIGLNGIFKITSKIVIDRSNVRLIGYGADARHDAAPASTSPSFNNSQPASALVWAGASGGTMVEISPAANQNASLGGIGSLGVAYICSVFPNTTNVADYGLVVRGASSGDIDFFGQECGQANILLDSVRTTPAPFEASPKFLNVRKIDGRNITATGALLKLDGLSGVGNTYNNHFTLITGLHRNGPGVVFGSADNNTVDNLRVQRADGGTGIGVLFSGGTTNDNASRANVIRLLSPGAGGVVAQGGSFPSYQNKIEWYNPEENSAPAAPSIQAGATLFWRSTQQSGVATTSARLAADQSTTAGTFVKLAFATANADANTQLISASNRIQPKYPGQYRVVLTAYVTNPEASANSFQIAIRKNDGSVTSFRAIQNIAASQGGTLSVSAPVYLNGTTDYVEAWIRNGASTAATVGSAADLTTFSLVPIN